MDVVEWIVVWGAVAVVSAVVAGVVAGYKRRDISSWAAWCFLFPPLVIVVIFLSANTGPRPRRPSFDEDDMTAH